MPKLKSHSPKRLHKEMQRIKDAILSTLPEEARPIAEKYNEASLVLQFLERDRIRASKIVSKNGKQTGRPTSMRVCNLEGCGGLRIGTRWKDGKLTWPCTRGMKETEPTVWRIE